MPASAGMTIEDEEDDRREQCMGVNHITQRDIKMINGICKI
jgi:hypothetical protein